jgi:quinohemoprotein ethanol dehydrogenase
VCKVPLVALTALFTSALAWSHTIVDEAALADEGQGTNWLSTNRTYSEDHYSPLRLINEGNVTRLGLAWYLDLPGQQTLEATPLAVDGVLYFSGTSGKTYAVDGRTGRVLWTFDPVLGKYRSRSLRLLFRAHRGVAYWHDTVYVGVVDGRLFALDAKSGKVVWSVQTAEDPKAPKLISGAPRVFKGKVIIGHSTGEDGGRGYVTAYDAQTGRKVWRFFTVPGDPKRDPESAAMALAAKTWNGHWWRHGGGGPVWDSIAYDPDFNRIYLGVGNGNPTNADIRSPGQGDNLFLCSIVALDADTGQYAWHYQLNPRDSWDYDATAQMVLAELTIHGQLRKVLMQASKNGYFYVIDRSTGRLISAEKFTKVNWSERIDLKTGRPIEFPGVRYGSDPVEVWPSAQGGHGYQAMSFDPRTGLVYIPIMKLGMRIWSAANAEDAQFELIKAEPDDATGTLLAWDPVIQRKRWGIQYDSLWNGGVLSTAGNLVFQGTGRGQFIAYSASGGERLWSFDAGLGIIAAPMTFAINGTQFISLLVGYGGSATAGKFYDYGWRFGEQPRRLLTFALDNRAPLPPSNPPRFTVKAVDDPALSIDITQAKVGKNVYDFNCAVCHGPIAEPSGSIAPDLRESSLAVNWKAFRSVLHEGVLASAGMPKFDDVSDENTRALFLYIRVSAREAMGHAARADK